MASTNPQTTYRYTNFPDSSFWGNRRTTVRRVTLPVQLHMLKGTGRYDAFKLKWKPIYDDPPASWPVPKHLFWDSDVAKWIEGACYFLAEEKEQGKSVDEVEAAVHELVEMIRNAQQEDGYLNIHYTVVAPGQRFTNLRDMHELYNAGHLIEAALAHEHCFHNDQLLAPILKYVGLLHRTFGPSPDQIHGYPGHPEIELALLRLYKRTHNPEHLQLAHYFISERGNGNSGGTGKHYYDIEREKRGEHTYEWPEHYPVRDPYSYQQAHLPITEQQTIEGHSVRAMYLLTAVADLMLLEGKAQQNYENALTRLWTNMVSRKVYLTGGIGAIYQWEGFGDDYFLPQSKDEGGCYAETCAGIGVVMLAERILAQELRAEYADTMELALYNAVLTGMSHDGKKFTYVNQLGSGESSLSERQDWFDCACCPPNVTRLLGSIGGYLWTAQEMGNQRVAVNVHLYTRATLNLKVGDAEVEVEQSTDWPFGDGTIGFSIRNLPTSSDLTLRLRIPLWASSWYLDPPLSAAEMHDGYLLLPPTYLHANASFTLRIPLKPRLLSPHLYTNQRIAAVARGPLVYCAEDVDNPWEADHFKSELRKDVVEGEEIVGIRAEGAAGFLKVPERYNPSSDGPTDSWSIDKTRRRETLRFVPYYARANREGKAMMRVGLRILQ
ncbi:DUF1680-domain-containing protein [Rhizodiscina lignyota]|uniref:DUF1680-domain-containing protein n=1 Tax=Rhizodiscina lignyota TaxID=1504668 RepID=A0A9P4I5K9_9PEZI|nr:DUF1680-domain-containing protein [Rhizodiscina lignyota]